MSEADAIGGGMAAALGVCSWLLPILGGCVLVCVTACRRAVEEDGQNYYAATVNPGYVWALGWRSNGERYVYFALVDDEGLACLVQAVRVGVLGCPLNKSSLPPTPQTNFLVVGQQDMQNSKGLRSCFCSSFRWQLQAARLLMVAS